MLNFDSLIPFLNALKSLFLTAGRIQISNSTSMILDMQGGFLTAERGGVEIKVPYSPMAARVRPKSIF